MRSLRLRWESGRITWESLRDDRFNTIAALMKTLRTSMRCTKILNIHSIYSVQDGSVWIERILFSKVAGLIPTKCDHISISRYLLVNVGTVHMTPSVSLLLSMTALSTLSILFRLRTWKNLIRGIMTMNRQLSKNQGLAGTKSQFKIRK